MKLPFLLGEKRYIFETMILDRDFLILIKTVVAISRMSGILSFEKNFFKNETNDDRLMKLSDEQCGRIVIFLFQRNDNGLFYSHYFRSNHCPDCVRLSFLVTSCNSIKEWNFYRSELYAISALSNFRFFFFQFFHFTHYSCEKMKIGDSF